MYVWVCGVPHHPLANLHARINNQPLPSCSGTGISSLESFSGTFWAAPTKLWSLCWAQPSLPRLFLPCCLSTQVQPGCKDSLVSCNGPHDQNRTVTSVPASHLKGTLGRENIQGKRKGERKATDSCSLTDSTLARKQEIMAAGASVVWNLPGLLLPRMEHLKISWFFSKWQFGLSKARSSNERSCCS